MQNVGHFERVSFEQFRKDIIETLGGNHADEDLHQLWEEIELPTRATSGSAGYDFHMPYTVDLAPGETVKIPTGVRVSINGGWFLGCFPRSGLGFKYRLQLDNTVGIIDSDYYWSDNEGHIFAKLTNDSKSGKALRLEADDKFMQGIFMQYGITYEDHTTAERNGGMGSTGA